MINIAQILESFTGEKFNAEMFSSSTQAEVCVDCLTKLEQYDKICLEAARIQEEIVEVFKRNQEKCRSNTKDFLKCMTCFAQCSSSEELDGHDCIVDNDELYEECVEYTEESSCGEEGKGSATSKSLKKQVSYNYTCNTCGEHFEKKREYQLHAKLAHLPENAEVFTCSQCNDSLFVSEMELKLHNVCAHPTNPSSSSFQCPICSKHFSTKALLNRHFGIHSSSSERPHICEVCGKTFFHYSSFQLHAKMHLDIRDYICTQCTKTFRSQSHLNRHLKTHSKVKNHECSECGSRFAERYNLTSHLKTHFGISRKKRQSITQVPSADRIC